MPPLSLQEVQAGPGASWVFALSSAALPTDGSPRPLVLVLVPTHTSGSRVKPSGEASTTWTTRSTAQGFPRLKRPGAPSTHSSPAHTPTARSTPAILPERGLHPGQTRPAEGPIPTGAGGWGLCVQESSRTGLRGQLPVNPLARSSPCVGPGSQAGGSALHPETTQWGLCLQPAAQTRQRWEGPPGPHSTGQGVGGG